MNGDLRNWLERLGSKIPGYSGYSERERRRDVDKLQREHLADRLRSIKAPLVDALREMTDGGRLAETGAVDRALKKLDQIENRVRFASYGYSGFFDAVRVEEAQLDALHRFDLALVERVDELEAKARALVSSAGDGGGGAKLAATEVEREIDELNRAFDERSGVINNFKEEGGGGEGGAPGKPMFGS